MIDMYIDKRLEGGEPHQVPVTEWRKLDQRETKAVSKEICGIQRNLGSRVSRINMLLYAKSKWYHFILKNKLLLYVIYLCLSLDLIKLII